MMISLNTLMMGTIYGVNGSPIRYLGAKGNSLVGVVVRCIKAVFEWIFRINTETSFKDKIFTDEYRYGFEDCQLSDLTDQVFLDGRRVSYTDQQDVYHYGSKEDLHVEKPEDIGLQYDGILQFVENRDEYVIDPVSGLKAAFYKDEKSKTISLVFGVVYSTRVEHIQAYNKEQNLRKKQKNQEQIQDSERLTPEDLQHLAEYKRQYRNLCIDGSLNMLGFKPHIYEEADALYKSLQEAMNTKYHGYQIKVMGECLGGSLAQYVAIKNEASATLFNPLALGAGLQWELGNEALRKSRDHITTFIVRTDMHDDAKLIVKIFDRVMSFLGLRMPGNFGRKVVVETKYPGDKHRTHHWFIQSLQQQKKNLEQQTVGQGS